MTSTPTFAFLGTGRMGLPMAMNLARAGLVHADDDLAAVYTGARTS
jgi:3-hydroxyisobutyrate dehydrogenase-like beta-hydroxyacid dehydrogenase